MDFDFNLILVPLTLALGLIWLLDKLAFKQRKSRGRGKESLPVRWAYDFFPVLAVVLIVRSFLIEPFNIPSSSMVPTLYTGDFIAVNKYAYGVRLPLTYNKVLDTGSPEHGDVMVFRYPENPSIYYIKRVIGLPGDTVSYDQGQISINGVPVVTESVTFNPETGKTLFAEKCSTCHGADGEGQYNDDGTYIYPAVAGDKSFNDGAGMARTYTAASFIKGKMPFGQGNSLTDQEAVDIAAYFTHLPRPVKANKDKDWPNGDAPKDVRR